MPEPVKTTKIVMVETTAPLPDTPLVIVPTRAAITSKLNWVGILTMLVSVLTYITQNVEIPTQYVTIVGFIIGALTSLIRVFGSQSVATVFGKNMNSSPAPELVR